MRTRLLALGILVAVLIAAATGLAIVKSNSNGGQTGGDTTTDPVPAQVTGTTSVVPSARPVEPGPLSGLNLTAYTSDGYSAGEDDLARIKELGSTAVTLVPTWYMDTATSDEVHSEKGKSPNDDSIYRAIDAARNAGLKVILKPHVDVLDGTFRGDISPANRAAWFKSYRRFIDRYAWIAADVGADLYVVGTELKGVSGETAEWQDLIRSVGEKFSGRLTYAANWDEVESIQFWDALDLIGVDAYYPLSSEGESPTEEDLLAAWAPIVDRLQGLSEQWDRPVILSEIGYPTQADAAAHPWEVRVGGRPDQAAQAQAYEAAFKAFAGAEWLEGINWWSWRAELTPDEDPAIDYSPEGKQAEAVLSAGQAGLIEP
ncbi:MAG: hypothetical protein KDB62_05585 [Solirubrobacterales bacterium]|nr:hypothetical protein [Solirubrobacterales bacterium]